MLPPGGRGDLEQRAFFVPGRSKDHRQVEALAQFIRESGEVPLLPLLGKERRCGVNQHVFVRFDSRPPQPLLRLCAGLWVDVERSLQFQGDRNPRPAEQGHLMLRRVKILSIPDFAGRRERDVISPDVSVILLTNAQPRTTGYRRRRISLRTSARVHPSRPGHARGRRIRVSWTAGWLEKTAANGASLSTSRLSSGRQRCRDSTNGRDKIESPRDLKRINRSRGMRWNS